MNKIIRGPVYALQAAGISYDDATALRRISMTLHRWHELECGNSDPSHSYVMVRGATVRGAEGAKTFRHDENGKPFMEVHAHRDGRVTYSPRPDYERGALKRLVAIMARYP